jgi:hypothetical protein
MAVKAFVMIFCRQRNVRVWMMDREKDLVACGRMLV